MQRTLQVSNGKSADEQVAAKINAWMQANPDAKIVSILPVGTEFLILVEVPDGYREIEDYEMECG